MQIPQELPQFNGKKTLIIVSGELQVKYYIAHKGEIDLLDSFFVVNPHAKLPEDYTKVSTLGMPGNVQDRDRQVAQKRLLLRLEKEVAEILEQHHIADTYLFCIDFMINRVKEALPDKVRKTIRFEHLGDMQYHTPLNLLEIIHEERGGKRQSSFDNEQ